MQKFWQRKEDALEREIKDVEERLDFASPGTDDYDTLLNRYERLCELRDKRKPERISVDTWAKIVSNLLAIALIMNFERLHVIATKAFGFVTKPRI